MQVAITIAIAAQTMMLPAVCPQEVWEDVPFWDASITARTMIANAIRHEVNGQWVFGYQKLSTCFNSFCLVVWFTFAT